LARESRCTAHGRAFGACTRVGAALTVGLFLGWGSAGCAGHKRAPSGPSAAHRRGSSARRLNEHALPAHGGERLSYAVQLDAELSRLDVEVCPTGFRIETLEAPSPGAQALLAGGKIVTPEGDYPCPDEAVDLPRSRPDECLRYTVIFPEKTPDPTGLRRVGRDLLASPDLWLWVPTPRPANVPMGVHFSLPDGVVAALPWPASGPDFALPETAFAWKSAGAFSHATPARVAVPGAELEWTPLGDGFGEHDDDVQAWLTEGAHAASLLFGHFPVPHTLVLAVPSERAHTSFGMALRGGGPAVVILLDRHVSAQALASDWTCTHEFLHLGVPRLPPEDAWLFEGLATYYTEVVRARAGIITAAQAYQHLLDGFERGRSHPSPRTLRQESAEMRENHAFYRVYWAGAALAFLTDVSARRAGGATLDAALRSFAECCAASEEAWDAERVLGRLDASLGAPRFAGLAHAWLERAEFPDLSGVLRDLGVSSGPHGEALFTNAPSAALRDAIMARASQTGANGDPHQSQ
jgi:hypothetical protein